MPLLRHEQLAGELLGGGGHRGAGAGDEGGTALDEHQVVVGDEIGEDVLEHRSPGAPQRGAAARAGACTSSSSKRPPADSAAARMSPASKARRKAVTILASKRLPVRRVIVSTANCRL